MAKSSKFFYGWWIVFALMIVSGTALALVISTFNIYLNPFTHAVGISATQFALCSTIINITVMLFSPKVGKIMQSHTKKTLLVFLTGFCLSYAAFAFAHNLLSLYIVAALFGFFSTGMTFIPPNILVNRWFVEKKGLAMSISLSGSAFFGMALSPYITYCIQKINYQFAYQSIAAMMFVGGVLLIMFLIKESPEQLGLKALGEGQAQTSASQQNALKLVHLDPKTLKRKPFFWSMLAAQFLVGVVGGGIVLQLPVYLQNTFGMQQAAQFLVITLGVMIFAKVFLGWLFDKVGLLKTTTFIALCILMTCIPFMFVTSSQMYILGLVGVLFWGVGNCIGTVAPAVIASKTYGGEHYGEVYGICLRFQTLGIAAGVPAISMIATATGSFTMVWIISSILTVLLLAFYLLGLKGSQQFRTRGTNTYSSSTELPFENVMAIDQKI
ncbi:MFS transporter [Acinetobacter gerneri]|jgi:MFS family permease|uniref:MFS transporter n=1 Tax=Acinetobacter gerneri TaxID=202952 RepID=UPI0023F46D41|nr:MFS transporter [Acinetobacter gerneri]MCH4245102.1 MFS transporter [Acinetobacter gerneri]